MVATYGFLGCLANIAAHRQRHHDLRHPDDPRRHAVAARHRRRRASPVGTAVDANVLIYERSARSSTGARPSPRSMPGFHPRARHHPRCQRDDADRGHRAVLFGSGPIRGFAVTHAIGVATTIFTAFTFARLMVALWVCAGAVRPRSISERREGRPHASSSPRSGQHRHPVHAHAALDAPDRRLSCR